MDIEEYNIPKQWGWCMGGNEEPFCKALADTAKRSGRDRFRYLELGPAKCGTMHAVCTALEDMGVKADVCGVELPNDPFGTRALAPNLLWRWWDKAGDERTGIRAWIEYADSRDVLHVCDGEKWDVIFIDACHCDECATRDFLAAEKLVADWGTVIFHDASPACQEWDLQRFHDDRPLRVRRAISRLGLLNGVRDGWRLVADLKDLPNGCAIVERASQ